jgi:hypothetical protein
MSTVYPRLVASSETPSFTIFNSSGSVLVCLSGPRAYLEVCKERDFDFSHPKDLPRAAVSRFHSLHKLSRERSRRTLYLTRPLHTPSIHLATTRPTQRQDALLVARPRLLGCCACARPDSAGRQAHGMVQPGISCRRWGRRLRRTQDPRASRCRTRQGCRRLTNYAHSGELEGRLDR